MNLNNSLLSAVLLTSLTACGGGGGGSVSSSSATEPAAPTAIKVSKIAGLYTGQMTSYGYGLNNVSGATVLIADDGDIVIYNSFADQLTNGKIDSVTTAGFEGSFTNYDANDNKNLTGELAGAFKIGEDTTVNGKAIASGEEVANYGFTLITALDKPANLSLLTGNFQLDKGGVTTSVSIDALGNITGSDTTGCVTSGTAVIPNDDHNLYKINVDVSSCGLSNGSYTGYAALLRDTVDNDTLLYTIYNASGSDADQYLRQ